MTLSCRQITLRIGVSILNQGRVTGMVQKLNSEMLLSILLQTPFFLPILVGSVSHTKIFGRKECFFNTNIMAFVIWRNAERINFIII